MDKVKNFCDHKMILWEMGANLLINGHFDPPPASFRVKILWRRNKIDSFSSRSITSPFLKFQVWLRSSDARFFNQCSSTSVCFGKSLCGFNQSPRLEIFVYSFSNRRQFGQVARSPQIATNIWRHQNYFEATWFDHWWLQTIAKGTY